MAEVQRGRRSVLSKIKLRRLGQIEDLMGAVVFLAFDASVLMTGSSLVVDVDWTVTSGRHRRAMQCMSGFPGEIA